MRSGLTETLILTMVAVIVGSSVVKAGLFDFVGDVVKAPLSFVGDVVGAPFGGFVNSLATPTIQSAEASGHRLASDLDGKISNRIDELNKVAKDRIAQIDESLEKRIAEFDKNAENRINQLDIGMKKRIEQINLVLADSIQKVDGVLAERIAQVDDLAERRIGNLDIVVTRAGVNFEQATANVITTACVMVFLCLLAWRTYKNINGISSVTWPVVGRLAAEMAIGAMALMLVASVGGYFTGATRRRADLLVEQYRESYQASLQVLDFRRACFLGSQLQVLNPLSLEDRGWRLKAELLRDVFARPTLLQSNGGISDLARSVREAAAALQRKDGTDDPDVMVVAAYILWQNGGTRTDEYRAACLCMKALEAGEFPLRPLAANYVQMYAHDPLPQAPSLTNDVANGLKLYDHKQIAAQARILDGEQNSTAQKAVELRERREKNFAPLMHVVAYDRLLRKLDRESSDAYVDMVNAQVDYKIAYDKIPAGQRAKLPVLEVGVDRQGRSVVIGGVDSPGTNEQISEAVLARHNVLTTQNNALTTEQKTVLGPALTRLAAALRVQAAWETFDRELKQASIFQGTSAPLAPKQA